MSSPPPRDWRSQVQQGLGEGEVVGEAKSHYYNLLLAIHDQAEKQRVPFTVLMIDIMSDFLKSKGITVEQQP